MLVDVFLILDILAICACGFLIIYLFLLSLLAFFVKMRQTFDARQTRRFAFVVPAHNEEGSIAKTIASVKEVSYPTGKYDVVVIADNCTDRTAEIARANGSIVLERTNAVQRSKGYALRWCFDQLLAAPHSYDAIVVVDADTIVAEDFLAIMNHYLDRGARAIQSSDLARPQPESWSAEMTRFGFTLYNYVRPMGRRLIGCSAGIRGNGMCFSTDTLREVPWSTYSLNEDLEYGLILLLHDITVVFAPEARVYATMPANARNAESQRSRWERGRFPIIKMYAVRLLKEALAKPSYPLFDAFIDLITPPFVTLFGALAGMFVLHIVLLAIGVNAFNFALAAWGFLIVAGLGHVFLGLSAARADALLYRACMNIPRYAFWKFALYVKALRRPQSQEWVRTTREASIDQRATGEK